MIKIVVIIVMNGLLLNNIFSYMEVSELTDQQEYSQEDLEMTNQELKKAKLRIGQLKTKMRLLQNRNDDLMNQADDKSQLISNLENRTEHKVKKVESTGYGDVPKRENQSVWGNTDEEMPEPVLVDDPNVWTKG